MFVKLITYADDDDVECDAVGDDGLGVADATPARCWCCCCDVADDVSNSSIGCFGNVASWIAYIDTVRDITRTMVRFQLGLPRLLRILLAILRLLVLGVVVVVVLLLGRCSSCTKPDDDDDPAVDVVDIGTLFVDFSSDDDGCGGHCCCCC